MFDIVVVTHGKFGEGLLDSAQMIMGHTEGISHINLEPDMEVSSIGEKLEKCFTESLENERRVLVLVDLTSASPFNQSLIAISRLKEKQQEQVHVLSGVNLPMLIEAINQRLIESDLKFAVDNILQSATEGIKAWHITDYLNE